MQKSRMSRGFLEALYERVESAGQGSSHIAKARSGRGGDPARRPGQIDRGGPSTIQIEAVRVKPLEYFWDRFAVAEPYDAERIRKDAERDAADEVIGE
jgi:hypothetical protein